MVMAKQMIKEIIEAQPDDASYEEIIREFAFERMIEKGLDDVRNGRVISDEEMRHQFRAMAGHSSNSDHSSPIKVVRADPARNGVCAAKNGRSTATLREFKGICQVSSN